MSWAVAYQVMGSNFSSSQFADGEKIHLYLTFFCACYVSENVNTFYKITGIKLLILKNW